MSMEDKLKNHVNYMLDCNKREVLDYAFTKYYEYENNDADLADYFFAIIGKVIIGDYSHPLKQMSSIKGNNIPKRMIVDAAYQYVYEEFYGLRGPLENIFGELISDTPDEPFIVPYINLIRIMRHNKEKSSKIAN